MPVTNLAHAQGDWGTQFGMLIQHLDDSRDGGLAGGAADEDVKDLQARPQPLCALRCRATLGCKELGEAGAAWWLEPCRQLFCAVRSQTRQAAGLLA